MLKGLRLIIITLIASATFCNCSNFASGSYSFAEKYSIDTTEDAVIKAIDTFKAEHESLLAPKYLKDGREDSSDYWYHMYFYLPEDSFFVYCWTRPETKNETTFAFVGVNRGTGLGNWKEVNKDFSSSENKKLLEVFERRILKPIKLILQQRNSR